ncbi:MAG: DUF4349 domain-containing protein, partial [Anaerolineales bacterium]|nr:DUF4349 domain-containing protein [Anaerolineales bacterium]
MNVKRLLLLSWVGLLCLLAACQPQVSEVVIEVTRVVTNANVLEGETVEVTRVVTELITEPAMAEEAPVPGAIVGQSAATPAAAAQTQQRLIIKDGRMVITVGNTEQAVTNATQLTVDLGGYIISQSVSDDDEGYKYATIRLAVPVDQFEVALRELRKLGEVTDESSSGEDVTEEYTDLNSRLTNLQATRDRLLEFLDEAQTIDEILEVNEELNSVEEEIAIIQGRINFLRDRAAFSTIDLTLNPLLPTPTPTPSPTPTLVPTPESWQPGDTAQTAVVQLQNTAQGAADFVIYFGILCGPWLFVVLLAVYMGIVVRRWWGRRVKREEGEGKKEEGGE